MRTERGLVVATEGSWTLSVNWLLSPISASPVRAVAMARSSTVSSQPEAAQHLNYNGRKVKIFLKERKYFLIQFL